MMIAHSAVDLTVRVVYSIHHHSYHSGEYFVGVRERTFRLCCAMAGAGGGRKKKISRQKNNGKVVLLNPVVSLCHLHLTIFKCI